MDINALLMDQADNVVTCVTEISQGALVAYRKGDAVLTLTATEHIPNCHKIALQDFAEGQDVIKYGEMIGRTTVPIKMGDWVSHENILSVPRDYDSEMI